MSTETPNPLENVSTDELTAILDAKLQHWQVNSSNYGNPEFTPRSYTGSAYLRPSEMHPEMKISPDGAHKWVTFGEYPNIFTTYREIVCAMILSLREMKTVEA